MKKIYIYIIISLLFSGNLCLSNNWLPFNPGQTSYYKISNYYNYMKIYYEVNGLMIEDSLNTKDRVLEIKTDMLIDVHEGYSTFHLINPLKAVENHKCYAELREMHQYDPSFNGLLIDSFLVFDNKFILFEKIRSSYNKYYKLEIPIFPTKGDSIDNNEYTIKYSGINNQEIFPGILDSVKTYSIIFKNESKDEFLFKLSKNFGIVYYEVFNEFIHIPKAGRVPLELIGIENKYQTEGITNPKVWDANNFFSLKVGDVKYWVYQYSKNSYYLDAVKFFKDSLVDVFQNSERISFKFDRYEFGEGGVNKVIIYENYQKDQIQNILDYPTSNIFLLKLPVNDINDFGSNDKLAISGNFVTFDEKLIDNKNWGYSFLLNKELKFLDSCVFLESSNSAVIRIFPEIGLVFQRFMGDFGGDAQNLIGYTINNKTYGDLLPNFTSFTDFLTNKFTFFPNPTSVKLTLSNIPDGAMSFEIFDIFGVIVLSTPSSLSDATPQEGNYEIDVSGLTSGIYFLKLNNQQPVKFIKL